MMSRRTAISFSYAGGRSIGEKIEQFSYTDVAGGASDSVTATLNNSTGEWIGARKPAKGVLLEAAIIAKNGKRQGEDAVLDCGEFMLDSFSAGGMPSTATIGGVAVPADEGFRTTQRTATYMTATVEQIAKKIAAAYGLTLRYEGETILISAVEQSKETDCAFLFGLCETYGLTMKIYRRRLVIFDRERYKMKNPVATITISGKTGWSLDTDLAGSYTGGELTYTDPDSEADIKVAVGKPPRILALNAAAANGADAKRIITAAVNAANHSVTTLTVTLPGDPARVASQTITVTGIGQYSGKYYIDKITHNVGSGYTMTLNLSLIEAMTAGAVADACAALGAVGVMDSPTYWTAHAEDVTYLPDLIINMAGRIKRNRKETKIKTPQEACVTLTAVGVMNTPEYWATNYTKMAYLGDLLIKAANAIGDE